MKLKYLFTIIIVFFLFSCHRTYESKFVISGLTLDYFPTFINDKTLCDSIKLDLEGSKISQFTLVVLSIQKEFVENPKNHTDVPFEGMYGRLDSVEKFHLSDSLFLDTTLGVSISLIPNINNLIHYKSCNYNGNYSTWIDRFNTSQKIMSEYNNPNKDFLTFYGNKKISFPFLIKNNDVEGFKKDINKFYLKTNLGIFYLE